MKVLNLNGDFYLYPKDSASTDAFANMLENNDKKYIKLRKLIEKNCVSPYYILEEIKEVHIRVDSIDEISEEEVVILERDEYEKMLINVKKKLCARRDERDECFSDSKEEFREKLCLDGSCFEFCED